MRFSALVSLLLMVFSPCLCGCCVSSSVARDPGSYFEKLKCA